jgi:hypothetical protein
LLPLGGKHHVIYQKATTVINIKMAHVILQKLLKFFRLLLSCAFLLVRDVFLFPWQTEINKLVAIHH